MKRNEIITNLVWSNSIMSSQGQINQSNRRYTVLQRGQFFFITQNEKRESAHLSISSIWSMDNSWDCFLSNFPNLFFGPSGVCKKSNKKRGGGATYKNDFCHTNKKDSTCVLVYRNVRNVCCSVKLYFLFLPFFCFLHMTDQVGVLGDGQNPMTCFVWASWSDKFKKKNFSKTYLE